MELNKIFKIIKNIIINAMIFILGIIAIIAIWTSIQLNMQNKEYVDIFGYSIFSTSTGSMSPTIEKGDIVIVKIGEKAQEKDIITYKKGKSFITHRIIEINEDSIIVKGDNNNTQDAPINQDAILGKVIFIMNNVEIWKRVFSDRSVIIPVVVTVILFIILVSYKEKTGEKNDR